MNTIKTVFLAALLSAAAYGVYVGVTGAPPSFGPRRKAHDWDDVGPPEPFGANSFPASPAAPLVSVGEPPVPPAAPNAAAPPTADSTAAAAQGPPADAADAAMSAAVRGTELPPDRYSSTQAYPSTRPDAPVAATEAGPAGGDRYASDPRYPSAGQQVPPAEDHREHADDINADYAALMQSVQSLLGANRFADAHLELSDWYGNPRLSPEQDAQLTDLLDRLAGTVIYSREHLLERPYEVQPGDSLEKIAELYEVPPQLLANINGIRDVRDLQPGRQLKVVKGPFNACVCLSKYHLVLYLGSRYAGRFPIGIGSDGPTTDGEFSVQRKLTNPIYYGRPVIDKDDPSNPLGEYALDLGGSVLIHGTNNPAAIGRTEDRGCIRLGERDIQDVFNILVPRTDRTAGSKVKILRQPYF